MSEGDNNNSTSSSVAEPAAEVKPYLSPYLSRANALSKTPYQNYAGQTVAGLNDAQTGAFGMVADRAMSGSPVQGMANVNAYNTLNGAYLSPDSNPWLQQNVDSAMGQASGAINAQFNKPGAFGNTAHQGVMSRELGGIASSMYGQNYGQERQNQMATMQFAPQLAQADYNDANALMGAGDAFRSYQQQNLDDSYRRWTEAQNAPYKGLDVMGNAIMSTMGAGGKTSMYGPSGSNTGQYLGAGLTAAGLLA